MGGSARQGHHSLIRISDFAPCAPSPWPCVQAGSGQELELGRQLWVHRLTLYLCLSPRFSMTEALLWVQPLPGFCFASSCPRARMGMVPTRHGRPASPVPPSHLPGGLEGGSGAQGYWTGTGLWPRPELGVCTEVGLCLCPPPTQTQARGRPAPPIPPKGTPIPTSRHSLSPGTHVPTCVSVDVSHE